MTEQEYAGYQERVAFYLKGCEAISTGPRPGCPDCGHIEEGDDYHEEPWISSQACEICNSPLGGDRESWHCIVDGTIVHGTCCSDCVYFIEYGRLDDQTVLSIERSEP